MPKRAIFINVFVKFEVLLLSGNVVLDLLEAYNPFENLMKAGEPLLWKHESMHKSIHFELNVHLSVKALYITEINKPTNKINEYVDCRNFKQEKDNLWVRVADKLLPV